MIRGNVKNKDTSTVVGQISQETIITAEIGKGDHNELLNKNLHDQHTIGAITGLADKLEELQQSSLYVDSLVEKVQQTQQSNFSNIHNLISSLSKNKVDKSSLQDNLREIAINYTTKNYVNNKLEGKADIVDGIVPDNLLPDYDNIVVATNVKYFPKEGIQSKLYIDRVSNLIYRWDKLKKEYIIIARPSIAEDEFFTIECSIEE